MNDVYHQIFLSILIRLIILISYTVSLVVEIGLIGIIGIYSSNTITLILITAEESRTSLSKKIPKKHFGRASAFTTK